MLEVLDAPAVRRWVDSAVAGLANARQRIDALNVYPVPDGDTGTNMHLTLAGGREALEGLDPSSSLPQVADAFARGCLLAARGNSGIITAQLLRGWADAVGERGAAGPDVLREALRHADGAAWAAVAEPVEGTILSVSRAAASAAQHGGSALPELVDAITVAAREALERTPEQLSVLAEAGVVDAGGAGLLVLLEALQDVVAGREAARVASPDPVPAGGGGTGADGDGGGTGADGAGDGDHGYEVMYLLDAAEDAVPELRARLTGLGGCVVVVGGTDLWNVHVHTDDPGAAVEAGIEAGRPHRIRITSLDEQVREAHLQHQRAAGVVAFAAGPGLARVFEEAGAVAVQPNGAARASTAEVLDAVRATGAPRVVVLPNDPDTLAVAQVAAGLAREEGLQVAVIPTRAQVQGLAAAAVHDPDRDPAEDVVAMSSAAGATRHGAVTVAARDAITSAGRCRTGDVLGVVDGDFAVVGSELAAVTVQVLERLLSGGGELVTLVVGADAPPGLAAEVRDRTRRLRGDVEVQVVDGGQGRYPLLVGVE